MASSNCRKGGYDLASYGRSEYGNAASAVEPRYSFSRPADHEVNVARDQFLKFTTYCFSDWIELDAIEIEISEDGGLTYLPAMTLGQIFQSPYDGSNSKIYRSDSQRIDVIIEKTNLWVQAGRVIVRFTGVDEHGQSSSKTLPVFWD